MQGIDQQALTYSRERDGWEHGACKEYPQLPQVRACGGLDFPQFGQFIPTSPAPKLSLDHHARPG